MKQDPALDDDDVDAPILPFEGIPQPLATANELRRVEKPMARPLAVGIFRLTVSVAEPNCTQRGGRQG
jgi:hypothetical protein